MLYRPLLEFFLFLFFLFWLHPQHAEVPRQGSNLSHSSDQGGSLTARPQETPSVEKSYTFINKEIREFFPFYGCTCGIWKFLGEGLNRSCSCDLFCSWAKASSSNPMSCAGERTSASAATQVVAIRFLTHCVTVGTPSSKHLNRHNNSIK